MFSAIYEVFALLLSLVLFSHDGPPDGPHDL